MHWVKSLPLLTRAVLHVFICVSSSSHKNTCPPGLVDHHRLSRTLYLSYLWQPFPTRAPSEVEVWAQRCLVDWGSSPRPNPRQTPPNTLLCWALSFWTPWVLEWTRDYYCNCPIFTSIRNQFRQSPSSIIFNITKCFCFEKQQGLNWVSCACHARPDWVMQKPVFNEKKYDLER